MKSYKIPVSSINKFSDKEFNMFSFSARDYRKFLLKNKNTVKLNDLLSHKEKIGKEIGSNNYMKKSKYNLLRMFYTRNTFSYICNKKT